MSAKLFKSLQMLMFPHQCIAASCLTFQMFRLCLTQHKLFPSLLKYNLASCTFLFTLQSICFQSEQLSFMVVSSSCAAGDPFRMQTSKHSAAAGSQRTQVRTPRVLRSGKRYLILSHRQQPAFHRQAHMQCPTVLCHSSQDHQLAMTACLHMP